MAKKEQKSHKRFFSILIIIVGVCFFIGTAISKKINFGGTPSNKIIVQKWNNFYEGYNIHFYYVDPKNPEIIKINNKYKLNEKVSKSKSTIDKVEKLMEWQHSKVKYKKGNMMVNKKPLEILKEVDNTGSAIGNKEYCSIFNEGANSIGLQCRVGKIETVLKNKKDKKNCFYVCEVWIPELGKWVGFDVCNKVRFELKNKPLSFIEVINSSLYEVKIIGKDNAKQYVKELGDYFISYSIKIDNSLYETKRSNTYITYFKENYKPDFENSSEGVVPSSIYVKKDDLFKISPFIKYENDESDSIPTLVLAEKKMDNKASENKEKNSKDNIIIKSFYGGAFKNSSMINEYYVSINKDTWIKVNDKYFTVDIKEGKNIIKLSLDGKNILREIVINVTSKK